MYTREPMNLHKPCYAPVNDITITSDGQLGLCCLDWKNNHLFGSLKHNKLSELLDGKSFQEINRNLAAGVRNMDLCSRCDWAR